MYKWWSVAIIGVLMGIFLVITASQWMTSTDDARLGQTGGPGGIQSASIQLSNRSAPGADAPAGSGDASRQAGDPDRRGVAEDSPGSTSDQTAARQPETERKALELTPQRPPEAAIAEGTAPDLDSDHQQSDDEVNAGTLSIAGLVVNNEGVPVAGVGISALALRLFADDADSASTAFASARETASDSSGRFRFNGLANGEYELRTLETFDHPLSARTVVRAGSTSVRLSIAEQQEIWVDGYVATEENIPLGQVRVYAGDLRQPVAVSDSSGLFGFYLVARSDKGNSIRLAADGYQDARVDIAPNDWMQAGEARVDIALSALDAVATVSGTVTDQDGNALRAIKVYLRRSGKSYETITNDRGAFELTGIQAPGSYSLAIPASEDHGSFSRPALTVPPEGIRGLEVVLDILGEGTVHGWMMDTADSPVRNFTLVARSQQRPFRPIRVTSDDQGYFWITNVPSGWLRIESESEPRFVIEGIMVESNEEIEVNPVLDMGNRAVNGQVVNSEGDPVPAASVRLSWRFKEGNVNHQSIRNTVSDASGRFHFGGIGQVPHSLYVTAPGYRSRTLEVQASAAQTTVRLEPST